MNTNSDTHFTHPGNTSEDMPNVANHSNFLGSIEDANSSWRDIRIAEMAGVDYLFVPQYLQTALSNTKEMAIFMREVKAFSNCNPLDITVISYESSDNPSAFIRFETSWDQGAIQGVRSLGVSQQSQIEFISMLYEHSQSFIVEHH